MYFKVVTSSNTIIYWNKDWKCFRLVCWKIFIDNWLKGSKVKFMRELGKASWMRISSFQNMKNSSLLNKIKFLKTESADKRYREMIPSIDCNRNHCEYWKSARHLNKVEMIEHKIN